MSFTFNGQRKSYVKAKISTKRPPWANIKRNLLTVNGMKGALLDRTDTEPRTITVDIKVSNTSYSSLQKLKEDLAIWLLTEEPAELIFDDDPDRVYLAVVNGVIDLDETEDFAVGTIYFVCPDPRKYSTELKEPIFSYLTDDFNTPLTFNVGGTTETEPVITVTLKEPTTFLDIIGENDYMRIGKPVAIDTTPIPEKEVVFKDGMESLTNWIIAQSSDIDGGVVTGTMATSGFQFYASNYGVGDSWHGPARIKSIGQSLTDFEVEITLTLKNEDYKKRGRVELYVLDSNKQAVCKLALKDITQGNDGNIAELRIGDSVDKHFIVNERGDSLTSWMNFEGILRLSRVGNKWTAYIAKFDANKRHTAIRKVEWTDVANLYTRKPANVVFHIGAHGTIATNTMSGSEIVVNKVNQLTESQVPYIGVAGDVFVFDSKEKKILKNGELFMKKDFGARFFKFSKGFPVYLFNPAEAIAEVKTEWRDAYL